MKVFKSLLPMFLWSSSWAQADPPAIHGMVLFGDQVKYVSHLPMFHRPHDYQVIAKVDIQNDQDAVDTLGLYEQAKLDGEVLFTLVPEVMDLTQLIDGSKVNFAVDIFVGHFERGGTKLPGTLQVKVESVLMGKKLDPHAPMSGSWNYLLFGEGGEYFAAHLIQNGVPSFDTIYKVSRPKVIVFGDDDNHHHRRIIKPAIDFDLEDQALPVVTKTFQSLYEPGETIGYSPFAEVLEVVHFETDDLAH